jgi:hypothetical protein
MRRLLLGGTVALAMQQVGLTTTTSAQQRVEPTPVERVAPEFRRLLQPPPTQTEMRPHIQRQSDPPPPREMLPPHIQRPEPVAKPQIGDNRRRSPAPASDEGKSATGIGNKPAPGTRTPDTIHSNHCKEDLDKLKTATSKLSTLSCDRFSSQSWQDAIKLRDDTAGCRTILRTNDAKADYSSSDEAIKDFGERCDCRKLLDSVKANNQTLESISQNNCRASLDQTKNNIDLESDEWDRLCKGIVSPSMNSEMALALNQTTRLLPRAGATCLDADRCEKLYKEYSEVAEKTIRDAYGYLGSTPCAGKLHEEIRNVQALNKQLHTEACFFIVKRENKQMTEVTQKIADIPFKCFYGQAAVIGGRCTGPRVTHVHRHQTGCLDVDIDIIINQYWCQEEEDMTECKKYETLRLTDNKDIKFCVKKDIDATEDVCVSPSVWGKCTETQSQSTGPSDECGNPAK